MLQLPMTPPGTFKLILEIHEEKGSNRIEMMPQPMIDLQGEPNLLVYRAVSNSGQTLKYLAYVDSTWVDFDPELHQPENFRKPKPESVVEPEPVARQATRIIRERKPIPKAGLDTVHVEPKATPGNGQTISVRVSSHVQPKQGMGPRLQPKK